MTTVYNLDDRDPRVETFGERERSLSTTVLDYVRDKTGMRGDVELAEWDSTLDDFR